MFKKSIIIMVSVVMLLMAITPATVFAADDTALKTAYTQAITRNKQVFAWGYSELNANDSYAKVRISAMRANGKDASALEAALSNYHLAFDAAMAANNDAKGLLDRHEGMGLSGNVMDAVSFKNTIKDANSAMSKAENTIRSAGYALHASLRCPNSGASPCTAQ